MDQDEYQRLVALYREMPDDDLAALAARREGLSEEGRQALMAVIAERPQAAFIQDQAAQRREVRASLAGRPTIGFWLGFLTFGLCISPFRTALQAWGEFATAERQFPAIVDMPEWQTYKTIDVVLCLSVFAASAVAVHAIHAGTTRGHLRRVVAVIWYSTLVVFGLDLLASSLLFGFENSMAVFDDPQVRTQLGIGTVLGIAWTAYLLLSERCRLRYPRDQGDVVAKVFE